MMKLIGNPRVRAVLIAGVSLAVVAAIGIGAANANAVTSGRWVTATAAAADVSQIYTTTGTVARQNTAEATFSVDGTVRSVKVAVGDEVSAGDVLAKLNTRTLKLAVLEAETSLAQAKLSLYTAQHPSSSTNGSNQSSATTGTSVDLKALTAVTSAVDKAVKAEAKVCDPIMSWLNSDLSSTDSTTATATASPSASPSDSASTTEPSLDELAAGGTARAQVSAAKQPLQQFVRTLSSGGTSAKPGSSASSSTTTSVSASQVAQAKAAVLSAEQQRQAAVDEVDAAELLAPISGTVGAVDLSVGDSASAGSITIVGRGSAVVSIELPLKTRSALQVGDPATVTPAGATTELSGKITSISPLETSGTSGDTTTYTTTIVVADPDDLLSDGAKATVSIPVASATGAVTVPVSALTPTGTGTGTVAVLAAGSDTPTTTEVTTGAVGGGLVQITDGLKVGEVVVLADRTAEIPSKTTSRTRSQSSSSSSSGSSSSSTSAAAQPSSQPSR